MYMIRIDAMTIIEGKYQKNLPAIIALIFFCLLSFHQGKKKR